MPSVAVTSTEEPSAIPRDDCGPRGKRPRRWRSVGWTVLLVPFLVLPYRWLWLPFAVAMSVLLLPVGRSRAAALRTDGTLIIGALLVLILRTALDPGWWLPAAGVFALLYWMRGSASQSLGRAGALTLLVWLASWVLLARPDWTVLGETPNADVPPDAVVVLAGDSLTAGTDINSDAATYVARLRDRLPCRIVNAGVANDETADLLARCEHDVLARQPTVVVVFIGGNDYLHGISRAQFAPALDRLVAQIASSHARIILVEVPAGIVWNSFAGVYRTVARKYSATLVPESFLRWRFGLDMIAREHLRHPFTSDGIHLSPEGASKVAEWLEPCIRRAMAKP